MVLKKRSKIVLLFAGFLALQLGLLAFTPFGSAQEAETGAAPVEGVENTDLKETASEEQQTDAIFNEVVTVEVFERFDCKHCQDEKEFWSALLKKRDDLQVNYHDIADPEVRNNWKTFAEVEGISKSTPITLIGNKVIQGFATAETTGEQFKTLVEKAKTTKNYTFDELIAQGGSGNVEAVEGGQCGDELGEECIVEEEPLIVNIPLIGATDVGKYSLPALSVVLGFVDGFNPCAMWVLVTFLLILVQVGDKRKMWQIAGLFILAEAVMYYLILNVWFEVWDFVGLDAIVTPIVGIIAIGGGAFFLWEWKKSDGTCKVTDSKQKAKTRSRIERIVAAEMTLLTVVGVIGIALSVNIIEFACSIGIPQAFTKILDLNTLGFWQRQFMMALYILFYMIDDLIVFGIALYSFEKIGLTTKYTKISNLIGGILMLILGAILIFKPELLVL